MINKLSIITLFCMLVMSCSSTGNNNAKQYQKYQDYIQTHQLVSQDKILKFRFNSWKSLDYKHLILSATSNKHYLITLKYYCNDLRSAHTIGLDQSMSSRLTAKFDSIVVPGEFSEKCRISTIHKLDKEQVKEVLALRRAKNS